MNPFTRAIRQIVLATARLVGSTIRDERTGAVLGKALLVVWRGKVHVIGLEHAVRPMFLPQKRLTYWKQELGFETHPRPDFPNVRDEAERQH